MPADDSRLRRRVCGSCVMLIPNLQRESVLYLPEAMRGMETASLVRAMCPRASEPASERPVLHLAEWYESVARLKAAHAAEVETQLESKVLALPNGLKYTTFTRRLVAALPGVGKGPALGTAWRMYKAAGKDKK